MGLSSMNQAERAVEREATAIVRLAEARIGRAEKGTAYRDETKVGDAPLFGEVPR